MTDVNGRTIPDFAELNIPSDAFGVTVSDRDIDGERGTEISYGLPSHGRSERTRVEDLYTKSGDYLGSVTTTDKISSDVTGFGDRYVYESTTTRTDGHGIKRTADTVRFGEPRDGMSRGDPIDRTRTNFDANGNAVHEATTDPSGRKIEKDVSRTFDADGRVVREVTRAPVGGDENGYLAGYVKENKYDDDGKLIETKGHPEGFDSAEATTRYEYDVDGNRVKETTVENGGKKTTTVETNPATGERTETTTTMSVDGSSASTSSKFDRDGNKFENSVTLTDPSGKTTTRRDIETSNGRAHEFYVDGKIESRETVTRGAYSRDSVDERFRPDGSLESRTTNSTPTEFATRIGAEWTKSEATEKYRPDGSLESRTERVIEGSGFNEKAETYRADGSLETKKTSEYDTGGGTYVEEKYKADGSLESKTTDKTDIFGKTESRVASTWDADGRVTEKEYAPTDRDGAEIRLTKETVTEPDGSKTVREHDAEGKVEETRYDADGNVANDNEDRKDAAANEDEDHENDAANDDEEDGKDAAANDDEEDDSDAAATSDDDEGDKDDAAADDSEDHEDDTAANEDDKDDAAADDENDEDATTDDDEGDKDDAAADDSDAAATSDENDEDVATDDDGGDKGDAATDDSEDHDDATADDGEDHDDAATNDGKDEDGRDDASTDDREDRDGDAATNDDKDEDDRDDAVDDPDAEKEDLEAGLEETFERYLDGDADEREVDDMVDYAKEEFGEDADGKAGFAEAVEGALTNAVAASVSKEGGGAGGKTEAPSPSLMERIGSLVDKVKEFVGDKVEKIADAIEGKLEAIKGAVVGAVVAGAVVAAVVAPGAGVDRKTEATETSRKVSVTIDKNEGRIGYESIGASATRGHGADGSAWNGSSMAHEAGNGTIGDDGKFEIRIESAADSSRHGSDISRERKTEQGESTMKGQVEYDEDGDVVGITLELDSFIEGIETLDVGAGGEDARRQEDGADRDEKDGADAGEEDRDGLETDDLSSDEWND